MPHYFFAVRSSTNPENAVGNASLPDDTAALTYACNLIAELTAGGKYDPAECLLGISNDQCQTVLFVPFLAAYA